MSVVGLGAWERAELLGRIARLEDENAALGGEQGRLEAETQRLEREREQLRADNERLRERNERLREEIEALRRAVKRQAAPFSKGAPKPDPKRAGRRPGAAYGQRAYRRPPQRVDRVVTVGLPSRCPGGGGALVVERVATQQVEDVPSRPR
jgi:regulator of replication initiation timing